MPKRILLNYMRNRKNIRTVIPWRKRLEYKGRYASKEYMAIAGDALNHIFGGCYVSRYSP